MINKIDTLWWSEIEIELFEEKDHIFGVEIDLFNNQKSYYYKIHGEENRDYYEYLHGDIYSAIDQFNALLEDDD